MNEHQVINLKEFQQLKNINLSKSVYKGLQQKFSRIIHVTPTMDNDIYHLTAKSIVGVFEYDGYIIQIKPKVDIPTIWDWLSVAYDLKSFQFIDSNNIGFKRSLGSLDWILRFFIQECKQIYSRGLMKGYISHEEAIRAVRGQWQPRQTFYRWLKNDYQFDCRFDELTGNVKENHLIAATLKNMMTRKYQDPKIMKDCKELFGLFGKEVDLQKINQRKTPTKWLQELNRLPRTRLNVYYHDAFQWAKMYWQSEALSFELGCTRSNSFLLDMNELFELYIGKLLVQELKAFNLEVILQKHENLADNGRIRIVPDVIIIAPSGNEIIIDLKYIDRQDESSINSNIFQMLAYLTARKTQNGILLYAGGPERFDQIKNSNITIHQWSLNLHLGLSNEEIKLRMKETIGRIVDLMQD